jgi:tRNA(Ile)-lysidine synthase
LRNPKDPEEALRSCLETNCPQLKEDEPAGASETGGRARQKPVNVLTAVSGGPDSMALLAAALRVSRSLPIRVYAAHLLHHPESEEARRRAELVREFCALQKVPLQTESLHRVREGGKSPEEWMREKRYQFLQAAARKFSCGWVLIGHHADDQAETLLQRIIAGIGWRGLSGIPKRRDFWLRPFLELRKSDLISYCQTHSVPFMTDPDNLDLNRPRNFIRYEILPALQDKLNPEVVSAMVKLGRWAEEVNEIVAADVDHCWKASLRNFQKGKIVLDINSLLPYFVLIRKLTVYRALCAASEQNLLLSSAEFDRIEDLIQSGGTGAMLQFGKSAALCKHKQRLIAVASLPSDFAQPLQPGRQSYIAAIGARVKWSVCDPAALYAGDGFTADLSLGVKPNLILRYAREGDRFHPLGARGEKRLFRFLTDRDVSRLEKRRTLVLENNGEIVWVLGHRISEKARARGNSERIWRLEVEFVDADALPEPPSNQECCAEKQIKMKANNADKE